MLRRRPGFPSSTASTTSSHAVNKGLLKIMSRWASARCELPRRPDLRGRRLHRDSSTKYFPGHASRIGGHRLDAHRRETLPPRTRRPSSEPAGHAGLDFGGDYHYRPTGSTTCWPRQHRQTAPRRPQRRQRRPTTSTPLVNENRPQLCTLRWDLLDFKYATPVPLEEVEPAGDRQALRATGAMSFGSISKRGPRDPGHRHEPPRRHEQHRRGRRGPRALRAPAQWRLGAAPSSRSPQAASA